ncbi:TonB-dependent receptor [Albibacterium profundi]|uniref:TonB-dependent receptor n=1 Tax=Albibacterium profundi TaxID=3134906 RepID=A0ABV5CF14_9SPHI
MIKKVFLLTFCLITSCIAFADRVVGTVVDGANNEPLAYASVLVKGTQTAVNTDFEGDYALELSEGVYTLVYTFVGYETKEVSDVVVEDGKVTEIDLVLNPANDMLNAVVITTTARKNTDVSLLRMQKNAGILMDGLSMQSIKRAGASDIAAAVKAVPGVSVQEGKYVYVRGLGDRYTKSILNGMDIPGLDPDKNTIQMDIFPTNILENIVVVKSASAELPADFTGGVVDIVTKDFPTQKQFGISISGDFNPDMHFKDNFLSYNGGGTDFLGFDDGTRKLPVSKELDIPSPYGSGRDQLERITRSFNPTMAAMNKNSMPDFSVGLNYGNQFAVGDHKLGFIASIDYKNSTSFYEGFENGIYQRPVSKSDYELRFDRRQRGNLGENNVLASILTGLAYKTDRSKYVLNLLRIQNGETRAAIFDQRTEISNTIDVVKDNLEYTQRSISNLSLSGKHTNEDASFTTEWKVSPTLSKVHDKDVRLTTFIKNSNGSLTIGSDAGFPTRIWRDLEEVNLVGKVDLSKKYQLMEQNATLKFGGLYSYKQRDFGIYKYNIANRNVNTSDLNGDPDAILTEENIWTTENDKGYYIEGSYQPSNTFDGTQHTAAIYVSNEFKVGEKLRTILGLRAEKFMTFFTGQNASGSQVYDNEKTIDELDFFPSANLIYELKENNNLRFSYYRTTARPTFKELSVVQIQDLLTGVMFLGNLDLVPTYINNFDLRYELFGDQAQMFAVSGFYKKFKNPIELVVYSDITPNQFTPKNAPEADVFGVEFEARKNFGFISEDLEKLSLNVNLSLIESRIKMSDSEYQSRLAAARDGEEVEDTRKLQGQSPYLINTGLAYNDIDRGVETGFFYNVQGKTLDIVGANVNPDVFVQPFNSLNFKFSKKIGPKKASTITIKVDNILDDDRESLYESYNAASQAFEYRKPGRSFGVGYSWTF